MRYIPTLLIVLISGPLHSQPTVPDTTMTVADPLSSTETHPAWTVSTSAAGRFIIEDGADAANLIPALQSLDYGSLGQFSPLLSHGATPQQTTLLFDDVALRDPILGSLSTVLIPTFVVRSIAFSGNRAEAPFGMISPSGDVMLAPLHFREEETYSKVFFRAGDWGYSDLGGFLGMPLSTKTHLVIAGDRQETDGFIINSKHTGSRILARLFFEPRQNLEFRYTSLLVKSDTEVPAPDLPDLIPYPSEPRRKNKRWDHVLGMQLGNLATGSHELNVKANFTDLHHETISDSVLFDNQVQSLDLAVEQQFKVGNNRLRFGGDLVFDKLESQSLRDRTDLLAAFFLGYRHHVAPGFLLSATGGAEKHQDFSARWRALANLEYQFAPNRTAWLGIRKAHRYPSFAERYWPDLQFSGNANLKPEARLSLEAGLENRKDAFSVKATFRVSRTTDFIEAVLADSTVKEYGPANVGKRTDAELSVRLRWQFIKRAEIGFAGSYYHFFDAGTVFRLHVPDYSAYGYIDYGKPFFDEFVFIRMRLIGRIWGKRYGRQYDATMLFPRISSLPNDAVTDVKFTFGFSGADIYVSWENLFDRQYQYLPGFFMPPRTLRFGIDWEFHD